MCHLPEEELVPVVTMGRRQSSRGNVMWEKLSTFIHVEVTLMHITYLNIVANQVFPYMAKIIPNGSGLCQQVHDNNGVA